MPAQRRLPLPTIISELKRVLTTYSFSPERAAQCAKLFAETSQDGVYSHGLNRFGRFIAMIKNGSIDVHATPLKVDGHGAIEQWDGRLGPGNLNASMMMDRALDLAREHGIGMVALRNTNHWMRGGTYGWQAADAGFVGICWTNTNQNLPPWGATEARIGNNPLIIAVPREGGHFVLDMAMSQFSYGALATYRKREQALPVPGGYDSAGTLSSDAGSIEASGRPLPVGFWKGSGLSILLDMAAAVLSAGKATYQISKDSMRETELSQCFLAISVLTNETLAQSIMDATADHLHTSLANPGEQVFYPGERTLSKRMENIKLGTPVDEDTWDAILAM